ncbi:MAG TPA: hypothetical protein VKA84_02295 [Gemmatimonadaceae bacterium]|nr:hypothetical protein [Gemmatimonadaceae bacterium]
MLLALATAALLQVNVQVTKDTLPDSAKKTTRTSINIGIGIGVTRYDTSAARDSIRKARRAAMAIPVTPELARTAFADDRARTLFERARQARLEQDSSLQAYDAKVYQRMSAGMSMAKFARDRLIFRAENSGRVRYNRGVGVSMEVTGQRVAIPIAPKEAQAEAAEEMRDDGDVGEMLPIPYYPGQEALWIGSGLAKADIEEGDMINPLAKGAEAYYQYEVGDSVALRLSADRTIRIRELTVRPRRPRWNLVVASLWFDVESARLVRAAYRLSEPLDVWAVADEQAKLDNDKDDEVPAALKAIVSPMRGQITAITIEYGLHADPTGTSYWWLPRQRVGEGEAQVSFMHVPFKIEESFRYASVSGVGSPLPDSALAPIRVASKEQRDSMRKAADHLRDSLEKGIEKLPTDKRDSARKEMRRRVAEVRRGEYGTPGCKEGNLAERVEAARRFEETLPVRVRIPCDTALLAHSPDLPASIFEPTDELMGDADREQLMSALDAFNLQPRFAPQLPTLHYGLYLTRYNRVEGFSTAVVAEQRLGAGYTAQGLFRLGTADLTPQAELTVARSAGSRTLQAGVFRRLAASNDWGNPLSFGSSLSGFLFGRDEGFYYYTWGAELVGTGAGNPYFSWRLFGERQTDADVNTQFSLAKAVNNKRFLPNVDAESGNVLGAGVRLQRSFGVDPRGTRLLLDTRGEGGAGDFAYTRGLFDATLSRGFGATLDAAITGSVGSSTGDLPLQRQFFLGGPQSVRGQWAGTMRGDAFWMTRAEVGTGRLGFVRPTVFGDVGWAGARGDWRHPGVPMSGVGVGASIMDGMLRFDVARGLQPFQMWRVDMYLEARF